MQHITLGTTNLRVSEFCLGTMTWGNQTPQDDAHRQIDMARDHGINFLDTAEMYPVNPVSAETLGRTEEVIGAWLAARGGRQDLVIATKVTGKGSEAIAGGAPEIGPARLRAAVEGSLRRLRTERIDICQLHWPNRRSYHFRQNWGYAPPPAEARATLRANMLDVLDEAARLMAEGKIDHFALSNETAWGMANWIALAESHGLPRPVTLQNEYSLLCRLFDTDLAELCALENVPLLAFSPLAAGLLTGKYAGDVTPEGSRRSLRADLGGRITPRVFEAVAGYLGLARDWGLDPVRMALAWCRTRPAPTIPILGATTAAQLAHALPASELTLPPELLVQIDAMHKSMPMPY
ncbi:MAG TPA: aldo/keto reductase [Paracoccus sp.]|nr:aldo/keto reductase [Paracoccus sp. (in: a-proteobacteria)]